MWPSRRNCGAGRQDAAGRPQKMLLLLLTCLLPTAGGKGCLRCWPELPALLNYDLQILWGSPGPPAELSQSLQSLFLEEDTLAKTAYLDRNHLEEATAKFFNELDQAIKKWRDDKPLLLEQVHMYKRLLAEKLTERSGELKERVCNESCDIRTPLEITECANCRTRFLSCDDPALCPAKHRRNHKLALGLSTILLVALAGGGCYALWLRKKKKEEAEKEQGKHVTLRDEQKLQSLSTSSLIPSPSTASSRDPFHPGHPRW